MIGLTLSVVVAIHRFSVLVQEGTTVSTTTVHGRTSSRGALERSRRTDSPSSSEQDTLNTQMVHNETMKRNEDLGRAASKSVIIELPHATTARATALDRHKLCFVHVGKTAGSLLSCVLGVDPDACNSPTAWNHYEVVRLTSPLSRRVQEGGYIHLGHDLDTCDAMASTMIVSIRNPLDRFRSAFAYESVLEYPRPDQVFRKAWYWERQWMRAHLFVDCYAQLQDLALQGLTSPQPQQSSNNTNNTISSNHHNHHDNTTLSSSRWHIDTAHVENMTCPERAWAMVTGARRLADHAWYNYEYYHDVIQQRIQKNNKNKKENMTILVLRTEHLAEDWNAIHAWLSSHTPLSTHTTTTHQLPLFLNGSHVFPDNRHHSTATVRSSAVQLSRQQPLTREAMDYLCQALCWELQYYKHFLYKAVNLQDIHRQASLDELQQSCPHEPRHVRTDCGTMIPTFVRPPTHHHNNKMEQGSPFDGPGKRESALWQA